MIAHARTSSETEMGHVMSDEMDNNFELTLAQNSVILFVIDWFV